MLRIAVLGAGRMGREVIRAVQSAGDLELAAVWSRHGHTAASPGVAAALISDQLVKVLRVADVAVDFSLPGATASVCDAAVEARVPLVSGVTGVDEHGQRKLQEAARVIPLLYDRNMSPAMAVLKDLLARAARTLAPAFVVEILETHHVHKKDAPSGTAMSLGEVIAASREQNFSEVFRYAPGGTARRSPDDIVYTVVRQGEVAGEHSVLFCSDHESLEFAHKVRDRSVFAEGALQAARWVADSEREPGMYRMSDLLAGKS